MNHDQAQFLLHYQAPILRDELKTTQKVLAAIPEGKKDYRPDPKSRTAEEIARHIASSEVWFLEGILNGKFSAEEGKTPAHLRTVADLVGWYAKTIPELLDRLEKLPPEKLSQELSFFDILNLPAVAYLQLHILHTVHHRGQLAAYLRPMGGKVPDIYGGSADEPFQPPA